MNNNLEIELNLDNLQLTKEISINNSKSIEGCDDPQFKRIHHNFHHIVLYIKDYIMKDKCKSYLEIGTHYGHSLSNILQSKYNSKIMTMDIFKRWGDSQIKDMYSLACQNGENFNKNNYEYLIFKGNSHSQITVNKVKEYFPNGIDLLFIDGDHTYNGIKKDFENYFPLVNSGGYIVFDDYLPFVINGKNRDAPKIINELVSTNKDNIEVIGIIDDIVNVAAEKHKILNLKGQNIDYIIRKK